MSAPVKHALGLNRRSYWRFLRRVYGMTALEAWEYIARIGTPPSARSVRAALGKADPTTEGE